MENAAQNVVELIGQRQDGLQEGRVPGKGTVSRVLERSLFPWVASTCEVDENDAKTPDIVRGASVKRLPGRRLQTLWKKGRKQLVSQEGLMTMT
jgi:uncharacterized membrane-anchored protein